jgi:hypothetical protein
MAALAVLLPIAEARPALFDRLTRGPGSGAAGTNGPAITIFPETIDFDTKVVTVRWTGVKKPSKDDVLNIYVNDGDTDKDHHLGYYPVSNFEGWETGSGLVTVPVFHPREHGFQFEVSDKKGETLALSSIVRARDPAHASQLHLSLTHNDTSMILTYTTGAAAGTVQNVQFSTSPFPNERSSKGLVLASGPWHSAWRRIGSYLPRASVSPWVGDIADPADAAAATAAASRADAETSSLLAVASVPAKHTGTYTKEDMCAEPASKKKSFLAPGNFRVAELPSLLPGRRYWYRVVDAAGTAISPIFDFVASPGVGATAEVDIIAFGDLGTPADWYTETVMQTDAIGTMRAMADAIEAQSGRFTAVLHVGDLAYANGKGSIWDLFMKTIEPVAARAPWMTTVGNHESIWTGQPFKPTWADYGNDSGGECSVPSSRRFTMPRDFVTLPYETQQPMRFDPALTTPEGEDDYTDMSGIAYSFELGPVHFTVFSSEHNFLPGSKQHQFVVQDLSRVDRKKTPWLVVATHRPMYCSTEDCTVDPAKPEGSIIDKLREVYEPIHVRQRSSPFLFFSFCTSTCTCTSLAL